MSSLIEIEGVEKEFNLENGMKSIILQNINLRILPGSLVSLVGHSGCGKSTILNIIAGLETATRGNVKVDGQIVKKPDRDRMVVFQNYSLLPWLNVWENVALFVEKAMSHKSKAEIKEIIGYHLEIVGLKDAAFKKPKQLSGGMKQRVAIARALAVQPKLLLLDEPFGALDALTRGSLQIELMRICEMFDITTVMVTHDVDEALLLSDQIVIMKNGPAATIGKILEINFPHPRSIDIVDLHEYHVLRHEILDFLHNENKIKLSRK
ncbi:ABC transporter ATP-binding protein [Anabaena sp. FACHB-1237]|uniref:ABC transporter ATP-binding protein n=1 Tax=Anabaena sp. FACHB-1237 TaxID=2692769 RepID=UPI001680FE83|nr:ABC transporter ATP-binding protein [Anabaena sp. FACHB-1237]MBD2139739.1 ABC transporter ATP-binding protein [Anabaena sp. FACHB-1237]